ncbi:twitching motility protein PilT [Clostridium sp.]|uniref:twitching motility protein PilT n=1 Tax=Clostridium sp. TaxID=1506 RepID=UPI00257A306C|nr:twitching motility protein PilT [Clostridium sp.]MBS5463911.1 twitching motility protein PilT [Clostridium sp.]
MVQIIAGAKGKGKTKYLLDMANTAVKEAKGSVVYLDKSSKHMYELNNQIRLINVQEYPIDTSDGFIGFICGIICQDHDLEQMYLDSFLKIAHLEGEDLTDALTQLNAISEQFKIDFCLSISVEENQLPEFAKEQVLISC